MIPVQLWIFLAILPVLILIAIAARAAEKKRVAALRSWAEANGWRFEDKDALDRPHRYAAFHPFGRGSRRRASNVFAASRPGLDLEVFDYRYTVQSGKHSRTYHNVIAVARLPIATPSLSIRPESLGLKLFDALGGEDIDVEDDAFSRRYWVKGDDRRFTYDVLHAPMQDFLMAQPDRLWQWRGHSLVLVDSGKVRPEDVQRMAQLALAFRDALPRHILSEVPRAR